MKYIKRFESIESDKLLINNGTVDRVTYYSQDGVSIFRERNQRLQMNITGANEDIICSIARIIKLNLKDVPLDIEYESRGVDHDVEYVDWLKALIILNKDYKQFIDTELGKKYLKKLKRMFDIKEKYLFNIKNKMEILKKEMDVEITKALHISRFDL